MLYHSRFVFSFYYYSILKELYKLGARQIAFLEVPPLGCLPVWRKLGGGPARMRVAEYNEAAQLANTKILNAINLLEQKFPHQYKIMFSDIFYSLLNCIANPQNIIHNINLYL